MALLAGCGSSTVLSSIATAAQTSYPVHEVALLYSRPSPLLAVLQTTTLSRTGLASVQLLLTQDFTHFSAITPPGPPVEGGVIGGFASVSFPTPEDGWVVESDADHSAGFLFHTTDGGQGWELIRQLWSGSAGDASVFFADPEHGWLAAGDIADDTITFTRTTDGGETWLPLLSGGRFFSELDLTVPVFANSQRGFAAVSTVRFKNTFSPKCASTKKGCLLADAPRIEDSTVEATADGGASWSPISVPVASAGVKLYLPPAFFATMGVLPLLVMKNRGSTSGRVTVDFDVTTDDGRNWASISTLRTATFAKVGPPDGDGFGGLGAMAFAGAPSVGIAAPRDWWVLGATPSGRPTVYRTADAGKDWFSPQPRGLPIVPLAADRRDGVLDPVSIQAVTAEIAFATIATNLAPLFEMTYLTSDGGVHWSPLSNLG
jgi:hypothetical protein